MLSKEILATGGCLCFVSLSLLTFKLFRASPLSVLAGNINSVTEKRIACSVFSFGAYVEYCSLFEFVPMKCYWKNLLTILLAMSSLVSRYLFNVYIILELRTFVVKKKSFLVRSLCCLYVIYLFVNRSLL